MRRMQPRPRSLIALTLALLAGACRAPARPGSEAIAAPPPIATTVRPHHGRPTLFVDGKPVVPMIYSLTDSPGGRWSWEEFPQWNVRNFARAGYNIIQFSVWLEDIWREDGTLDVAAVRRQFRGVLDAAPGAVLFMRLHINAPFWWNLKHPEETVRFADTEGHPHRPFWGIKRNVIDDDDLGGGHLHSLASERWRDETSAILRRLFFELAATPEGNALGLVNLCTGVSHEWHQWSFLKHDADTGPAMTRYFRHWLTTKYGGDAALRAAWGDPAVSLASARVPGSAPRKHTSDGVFRDPVRERPVLDYFQSAHALVADDIIHFDGLVKKLWPRPIVVGNFFGYYFSTFSRQTAGGHLGIARVLRAPEVDFLAAPQSYHGPAHSMGGSGQSRALIESALLHGKLVLDEMDQFTGLKRPFDTPPPDQQRDDLALIRRNVAQPLTRGAGMWFYDFGPNAQSGWWGLPAYTAAARNLRNLFLARVSRPLDPQADVLVVWDVDGYYDQAEGWTPISETTLDEVSNDLAHTGVVFDNVYLDDLDRVELARYKAVFFANTWRLTPAARAFIRDQVSADGRHVIWSYMSGYSDGAHIDLDQVSAAVGMHIARVPGIAHAAIAVLDEAVPAGGSYGIPEYKTPLEPFPVVDDPEVEVMGRIAGTRHVGLARKARAGGGATWYSSLPLRHPALLRHIFQAAGAHVWSDGGDVLHSGNGVLFVHTLAGGPRRLRLRNGKQVSIELPPRSTTLLDNQTGQVLLP